MDAELLLLPQGDEGTGFRTKNAPGERFRRVLFDRGDALIAKATIISITHGTVKNDDLATLLVFEFRFVSNNRSRRFIRSTITITFEDATKGRNVPPEVYRIAPEGRCALNRTETMRNTKQTANAGVNTGTLPGVGVDVGYVWEVEKSETREHWTIFTGMKRQLGDCREDNAVIWSMEENNEKKDGIPSFVRTAVLLRRKENEPFSFTVKIRTDVDFVSEVKALFGLEKADTIDPVEIDPEIDPEDLRVESLGAGGAHLPDLDSLDLAKQAAVEVLTLLDATH
ncbi:hypothetical protein BU26DRAFT_502829 [Trematosphaeria pertusa]|uniref:Uncharacterized protein n=1 Tax=Trematosphaeria pertusa TaxID=390896 RepID=A0A6A6IQL1_9PLEO|nr:uncharacterized protein BU26DRAFT_502829 [Trematosphaeria pertusa]KAF2252348.1 hypothetical protein BU26DRAFT_502829 [Trematosphaeria pertusa]